MPKVQYVNTIRTFDKEGFKKRAGCLCFKSEAENEVLFYELVHSQKVLIAICTSPVARYIHDKSQIFLVFM